MSCLCVELFETSLETSSNCIDLIHHFVILPHRWKYAINNSTTFHRVTWIFCVSKFPEQNFISTKIYVRIAFAKEKIILYERFNDFTAGFRVMSMPFIVWKFYTNRIAIWFSTVLWIEISAPTGNLHWKLKKIERFQRSTPHTEKIIKFEIVTLYNLLQ